MDPLPDEMLLEILLRLPPEESATLLRAAIVCKRWCRVMSHQDFRARFWELHRTAPVINYIATITTDGDEFGNSHMLTRFVPATPFHHLRAEHRRRMVDARHGRVLLVDGPFDTSVEVWDPFSGDLRGLVALPVRAPRSWNAAVVCAEHSRHCHHIDCHAGDFLLVFLEADEAVMRVHVYSSSSSSWSEPTPGPPSPDHGFESGPAALVGTSLHFLIRERYSQRVTILSYDLSTSSVSVIEAPPDAIMADADAVETPQLPLLGLPEHFDSNFVVLALNGSGLGLVNLQSGIASFWSFGSNAGGDSAWSLIGSVLLQGLGLDPIDLSHTLNCYVGFDSGTSIILLGTWDKWFSIDMRSGLVKQEDYGSGWAVDAIPCTSLYTPDLGQYGGEAQAN